MQKPQPSLTIQIIDAAPEHMEGICEIYTHYVMNTTVSFEESPPDEEELESRRQQCVAQNLPYLVALDEEGQVAGYSYAIPYRARSAYRYTVEDSVYLAPHLIGKGYGQALLSELIRRCEEKGYRQMIAVIGGQDNQPSIHLHKRLGFSEQGVLKGAGLKHGKWIDSVIMQRSLGEGDTTCPT